MLKFEGDVEEADRVALRGSRSLPLLIGRHLPSFCEAYLFLVELDHHRWHFDLGQGQKLLRLSLEVVDAVAETLELLGVAPGERIALFIPILSHWSDLAHDLLQQASVPLDLAAQLPSQGFFVSAIF